MATSIPSWSYWRDFSIWIIYATVMPINYYYFLLKIMINFEQVPFTWGFSGTRPRRLCMYVKYSIRFYYIAITCDIYVECVYYVVYDFHFAFFAVIPFFRVFLYLI